LVGFDWCKGSIVEEGGDGFGTETREFTELLYRHELVGLLAVLPFDAGQQLAPVTLAFAGDALHVLGVYDDAGRFHAVLMLYLCLIHALSMAHPFFFT
jgi:hypothetical protein